MDQIQQIISKISQVSSILIVTSGTNGDGLAAGLALREFLKKLEKEVTLFSINPPVERFDFLPGISEVSTKLELTKNFVINVSTKKTKLKELSYKKEPEQLSVFLKPVTGEFEPTDISFTTSGFPFEFVILIGVTSIDELGEFYSRNASLFFETPVLNIDFKTANENYGQFNLVDLTASSCSEIILDVINKFESSLIDEPIATQLLAGIIAETNSFQHVRTTPQVFLKASQLVSLGARQQDIVGHLYKSKSLGLLKLWGRVLARLKQDFGNLLVYSAANQSDVSKSEASEEDVRNIIKEMLSQLTFAKLFLFLKEDSETRTQVYCATLMPLDLLNIFSGFGPEAIDAQTAKFVIAEPMIEAEKRVLLLLKQHLPAQS